MRFDYNTVLKKGLYVEGIYFFSQDWEHEQYIKFKNPVLVVTKNCLKIEEDLYLEIELNQNINSNDTSPYWKGNFYNFERATKYYIYYSDVKKLQKIKI